jgi:DNA polymerase-3 subunit delta'
VRNNPYHKVDKKESEFFSKGGVIMSGFKEVIGHKDIIEYVSNITKEDKLSHAYILNGEKGSGKTLLANLFALAIQCETKEREEGPCKSCPPCKQGMNNNQPDIIQVTHEKPNVITVDEIRNQVNQTIEVKPYSSPYKVYIIDEADLLNAQAQNALLKNIEEPPPYGIFILLTRNANVLLETIRSRCVILQLKNIPSTLIKKYLVEQLDIPKERVDLSVAFASGSIGQAVLLAKSDYFNEVRHEVTELLVSIKDMDLTEVSDIVKKIKGRIDDKANVDNDWSVNDFLDLLAVWYRDVLLYKATKNVDMVVFKDQIGKIKKQGTTSSYEGVERILEGIENAKARLKANVNFELTMELLLLTIKEN